MYYVIKFKSIDKEQNSINQNDSIRLVFSKIPHDLVLGSIQNRGEQFLENWQSKISMYFRVPNRRRVRIKV